jgi:hypothetical protein
MTDELPKCCLLARLGLIRRKNSSSRHTNVGRVSIMQITKMIRIGSMVLAVLDGAAFPTAPAVAENDQVIVLDCSVGRSLYTVTLNLATRVAQVDASIPNPGGYPDPINSRGTGPITLVANDSIVWTIDDHNNDPFKVTLNRYTGNLYEVRRSGYSASTRACHRQQKQF